MKDTDVAMSRCKMSRSGILMPGIRHAALKRVTVGKKHYATLVGPLRVTGGYDSMFRGALSSGRGGERGGSRIGGRRGAAAVGVEYGRPRQRAAASCAAASHLEGDRKYSTSGRRGQVAAGFRGWVGRPAGWGDFGPGGGGRKEASGGGAPARERGCGWVAAGSGAAWRGRAGRGLRAWRQAEDSFFFVLLGGLRCGLKKRRVKNEAGWGLLVVGLLFSPFFSGKVFTLAAAGYTTLSNYTTSQTTHYCGVSVRRQKRVKAPRKKRGEQQTPSHPSPSHSSSSPSFFSGHMRPQAPQKNGKKGVGGHLGVHDQGGRK